MEPTFSNTSEVVVAALDNLLASSSPLVRVMLQHDGLVCLGVAKPVTGVQSKRRKKKQRGLGAGGLTGSFDLPLSGLVPQVGEAEDSIVILILSGKRHTTVRMHVHECFKYTRVLVLLYSLCNGHFIFFFCF